MGYLLLAQDLVLILLLSLEELSPLDLVLSLELLHIADYQLLNHSEDLQVLLEIDPAVCIRRENERSTGLLYSLADLLLLLWL